MYANRSSRLYLFDEISESQASIMNFKVLQKLEEVLSRLLAVEENQVKLQLEVDARLAEFKQNRDRSHTPPS